jgi:hypothetical protein
MKLFNVLVLAAALTFATTVQAIGAGSSASGSGNSGLTVMGGFNASHMDYRETENGTTLDRDYGDLGGIHVGVRYENRAFWSRLTADYTWTNNATYDGALQDLEGNTTPYKSSTSEKIYLYEGDVGYKLFNEGAATLTPYVGLGYRFWRRGTNSLPGYVEDYTWYYWVAGLNCVWRIGRFTVGADAAALVPFSTKMTTDVAGQYDKASFNIKSRVGVGARLPLTYDIHHGRLKPFKVFVFLTPYYRYWAIKASDTVMLTQNGVQVAQALEPDSRSHIYGADAGVGVNF